MAETGVITPPVVEWTLTGKGKYSGPPPEVRIYYQSELTLDAEVAVLGLVSRTLATLAENGFPMAKLAELQKEDGTLDIVVAGSLLAEAGPYAPGVMSEATAMMFGYLPTDMYGRRDPAYDEQVAFVRAALTVSRFIDVVKVYLEQNDWQRMAAPFADALRKGVELGVWVERTKTSPTT